MNPVPLVRAIVLTFPGYLLLCVFFAGMLGLGWAAGELLALAGRIPILPVFIGWVSSLYLLTVCMRGFGLFYRGHHD